MEMRLEAIEYINGSKRVSLEVECESLDAAEKLVRCVRELVSGRAKVVPLASDETQF